MPAPAWAWRLVIFRCRETLPAVIGVRAIRHDLFRRHAAAALPADVVTGAAPE
jgi:hypothetical protein